MMRRGAVASSLAAVLALGGCAGVSGERLGAVAPRLAPPMVVISESEVMVRQPPPHGAIGMSTAYRISDAAPQPRRMEFRRRVLDVGAAIGEHPISHDEVYYVTAGRGVVISDGVEADLEPGMAAYLYEGAVVGIRQVGEEPLSIIISYPVAATK